MAISTSLPGIKVTVNIQGHPAPEQEYKELESKARTTDRLLEAQSGQIFEIKMEAGPETVFKGTDLSLNVYIDGRYADGCLLGQDRGSFGTCRVRSAGCYVSDSLLRRYMFTSLDIVDRASSSVSSRSPSMPRSARPSMTERVSSVEIGFRPVGYSAPVTDDFLSESELMELGTIKIEISHVNRQAAVPFRAPSAFAQNRGGPKKDAKGKPVAVSIGFAPPEHVSPVTTFDTKDVEDVDTPAATFVFHYRSGEMLKNMFAPQDSALPLRLAPVERRAASLRSAFAFQAWRSQAPSASGSSSPLRNASRLGSIQESDMALSPRLDSRARQGESEDWEIVPERAEQDSKPESEDDGFAS